MKVNTETLATLAIGFASGSITEDYIRSNYGDSVVTDVMALVGGTIVGSAVATGASGMVGDALRSIDDHTGLVSLADDVIDSLNPFKW